MILLGWSWYAVVYVLFAIATDAWHVWVLFLFYGVFYAFTEAALKTLVAQLVSVEQRGLAYGWFNATIGLGALPASVMFGALYDRFGPATAFGTGACLAVLASVLLACVTTSSQERSTSPS